MAKKARKKKAAGKKAAKKKAGRSAKPKPPPRRRPRLLVTDSGGERGRKPAAPIIERLAINAPVGRVWAALTSACDLELITLGHVKMGSAPGAPYRWHWGVYEKVAPGRGGTFHWQGTILDAVPGSVLVLGPYPLVTITVKGEGGASLVTVVQPPLAPGDKEDYEEGWADFLLKLKTLLETQHWEREILARAIVQATPRQALAPLLDDKAMKFILPGKTKTQAKVGKGFNWLPVRASRPLTGTFLEIRRERRIVFQWDATQPASEVAIEAQPMPYGALVSVHHTGLWRLGRKQIFEQRMFWVRLLERLRCYYHFGGKIKAAV